MKRQNVIATLGSVLVVIIPIVSHTACVSHPGVRLALDCTLAALGVFGFTVAKPLTGRPPAAPHK